MIHFHKYTWLYILISAIVIGSGLFSFVKWGFRYSIDFTGGTTLVYSFTKMPKKDELSAVLKKNKITIEKMDVNGNTFEMQTNPLNEKQEEQLRKAVETTLNTQVKTLRFETVGPTMGKETAQKTGTAFILAICGILLYMSFAFKDIKFAFSAVLAMIHDFFVLVGSYSLLSHFFGASFDLMFVTAMLTTMSFSVHDTIVIFDKIREYARLGAKSVSIEDLSDKAVSETMVRSLNNSLTIVFMLVALLLLGGGTIRFFAAALLIGTITGSYSSPFVATPILIWLMNKNKAK